MIRLKVKEVAQQKKIGQNKLARLADLDYQTVRKIYKNPYQIINTETLEKLARALQVDASLLIESDPPLPKSLDD